MEITWHTVNDILNKNALKMRHKDKFVIILKTDLMRFTLGENTFHSWIAGELDLTTYTYTCKCLDYTVNDFEIVDKIDYKLFKIYLNDIDLQKEIYLMEDKEYNRRLNYGKNTKEV